MIEGIPRLLWYGAEGDYNILAMELLGSNLEELVRELHSPFSLATILLLADSLVSTFLIVDI